MTATATALAGYELPIEQLYPDPRQPRKAIDQVALEQLAASILVHGVLEPLIVHEHLRTDGKTGYTIVAGERRWRAAKLAGLKTVPVLPRSMTDAQVAEVQLVENLQREDLTALELANGYAAYLKKTGKSQAELAKAVGRDEGTISHVLALLALPKVAQQLVSDRTLSFAHARELARLVPYPKVLDRVAKYIVQMIDWGKVPTTRTVKGYVDTALDAERRRLKGAAARKKGKGRRSIPSTPIQDNLDFKRRQELRQLGERARAAALKAATPAIVNQFRGDRIVKLVKKIPRPIAVLLGRNYRPAWWGGQQSLGERLIRESGGGAYAKIATVLWLKPRWDRLDRQFAAAATKAVVAEQKKAAAKGGRK